MTNDDRLVRSIVCRDALRLAREHLELAVTAAVKALGSTPKGERRDIAECVVVASELEDTLSRLHETAAAAAQQAEREAA